MSTELCISAPAYQTSDGTNRFAVSHELHWSMGTVDQVNTVGYCCVKVYRTIGFVAEFRGPVFVFPFESLKHKSAISEALVVGRKGFVAAAVGVTVDTTEYQWGISVILSASSVSLSIVADSRVEATSTCVLEGSRCKKSCLKIFSERVSSPRSCFIRYRSCDGVLSPISSDMRS